MVSMSKFICFLLVAVEIFIEWFIAVGWINSLFSIILFGYTFLFRWKGPSGFKASMRLWVTSLSLQAAVLPSHPIAETTLPSGWFRPWVGPSITFFFFSLSKMIFSKCITYLSTFINKKSKWNCRFLVL